MPHLLRRKTVRNTYGGNGRIASVTDNRGTTSLAYETASDRVSSVTDPVTGAVSYTYFQGGERKTMSLPGGGTWNYAYTSSPMLPKDDPNSLSTRLYTITDDQNRIVSYSMDAQGRTFQALTNQVFDGNGALLTYQQTDYTFDSTASNPAFFLTRIKNTWWWKAGANWTSKVLTQNDYTYNVAGMRLTNGISDVTGLVRTETYGYDELYRLTSVNYGDSHTQSYTFDPMGNRLTKVNDGVSEGYTYNNANMLLTRGANNYTNDLDGNTLTGGGRTNTWDSRNRLVACVNGGNTSNFTYAADGIRHRSVLGANTTDYVCDGPMFMREKVNGAVSATFLMGPRGPEYRRDDSAGTVRWYSYDGLGSVLGEVDPNGNLTASRSYDVYGAVRTSAGTPTSKHKFVGNLGHPSEDETGLVYMRARFLDPATGRFMSQDTNRDGVNWFSYCAGNPISFTDETGSIKEWNRQQRLGWWGAGEFFFFLAIGFMFSSDGGTCFEFPSEKLQHAAFAIAVGLSIFCFGMAAIGMDFKGEVACRVAEGVAAVIAGMVLAFESAKAAFYTEAATAVLALLFISTIEAGFISSIGADIP